MRLARVFQTGVLLLLCGGSASLSQTLNEGLAAMERGDFFTAFSALRQLERAGDPQAAWMLDEIFLTPGAQPVTSPVVIAPPAAAPAARPATAPVARPVPAPNA